MKRASRKFFPNPQCQLSEIEITALHALLVRAQPGKNPNLNAHRSKSRAKRLRSHRNPDGREREGWGLGEGMNCATYCNRDPQQRVSVCVSVVGGGRARAAWSQAACVTKYSIVVTRQEPQVAAELVRHSRILPRLRVLPRKTSFQRFQQDIFHIHTYEKSLGICKLETVLYILCV